LATGILVGCAAPAEEGMTGEGAADEGMADGSYTGMARGYMKGLNMIVTVQDDRIVDIRIGEHNENEPYITDSLEAMVPRILETQSTSGIDAVSGATDTCDGIIKAVTKALDQAQEGSSGT
jgi:uncharacterized protein with FMN-binding domain